MTSSRDRRNTSTAYRLDRYARATLAALLLLAACPLAVQAQTGTLLFSSGFEQNVTLRPIDQADCWSNGCRQYIDGIDTTTGSSWPPNIWGGGGFSFLLADAPVDATTIRDYLFNQILTVTGHGGLPTRVLYRQNTQSGCCGGDPQGGGATSNALMLTPAFEGGDLYISHWVKYQPDLDRQLDPQNWRTLFSWKTGGTGGANDGDYRAIVNIVSWGQPGIPYWDIRGDNAAGADPNYIEYWRVENRTVPVPVGEWFKFEVFWHRSIGIDGRIWMAVNGQVIADHSGPNRIARDINRIYLSSNYGGGPYPLYVWLDDLQIWNGFPAVCTDPPCAPH